MSAANANPIPLTPQFLFEALQAASSQVQDMVKNASAQLKEWEGHPGYWSLLQVSYKLSVPFLFAAFARADFECLQDAFLDRSLPVEIRWLAIITLKQGVDKYWRKTAKKYDSLFLGPQDLSPAKPVFTKSAVQSAKKKRLTSGHDCSPAQSMNPNHNSPFRMLSLLARLLVWNIHRIGRMFLMSLPQSSVTYHNPLP
jgi:hypothetical protein